MVYDKMKRAKKAAAQDPSGRKGIGKENESKLDTLMQLCRLTSH